MREPTRSPQQSCVDQSDLENNELYEMESVHSRNRDFGNVSEDVNYG